MDERFFGCQHKKHQRWMPQNGPVSFNNKTLLKVDVFVMKNDHVSLNEDVKVDEARVQILSTGKQWSAVVEACKNGLVWSEHATMA
jgi:hypothetical protein